MSDKKQIERPRSVITGQFTNRIDRLTTCSEFLMIMIIFKPGALHRITGIRSSEISNKHIDIESLFPQQTKLLNEQLANAGNYTDMISFIEKYLSGLISKARIKRQPADDIFSIMLENNEKFSLTWLANQACLSTRQFERKADDYLGINPSHFARIVRFNQSYEMRLKKPPADWLSIAITCGYHDYQHLVKDYKEFASTTPNKLFEDESKSLERVLGLSK